MIRRVHHPDVEDFLRQTGPFLAREEAAHCLLLGLVGDLLKTPPFSRPTHFLWSLRENDRPEGAVLWSPKFPATFSRMTTPGLEVFLGEALGKGDPPMESFGAPEGTAQEAARLYGEKIGRSPKVEKILSIQELRSVTAFPTPAGGARLAAPGEREKLVQWHGDFDREANLVDPVNPAVRIDACLKDHRLWVWDDGGVACMAAYSGFTPTGVRVNLVYTPPERRGKGYAASLTAALSRHLLSTGRERCFLFVETGNPAALAAYRKAGYLPVDGWRIYRLVY
jgi:hypothetical protein